MKKIWLTANLFGLLVLTSGSVNSAEQTLEHMYWRTTSIGEEAISVPPQQIPHVAFHAEESRVAGFGGCNRFFASYEQNEENITISIMGGGRARCPELGTLEQDFMRALQLSERFKRDGDKLILMQGETKLIEFVGIEQ